MSDKGYTEALLRSRRSSASTSLYSDTAVCNALSEETETKEELKWYFNTPYMKYKERGRKPFKLFMQVAKIILVTIQATFFALDEFSIVSFQGEGTVHICCKIQFFVFIGIVNYFLAFDNRRSNG